MQVGRGLDEPGRIPRCWVFIEQNNGKIEGVSLELLGAGRNLADKLEVPLGAFYLAVKLKL